MQNWVIWSIGFTVLSVALLAPASLSQTVQTQEDPAVS
jgi:hypothetical protein